MRARTWRWAVSAATVLILGGAVAYGVVAYADYRSRGAQPAATAAIAASGPTLPGGPLLVFRNTASGAGYGLVASVPLGSPGAQRTVTSLACDRVYATHRDLMCLHTDSGATTSFAATLYGATGRQLKS